MAQSHAELLQSLANNHHQADTKQYVLFKLLKDSPERVTDEMLEKVRANLKKSLQDLEPYINPRVMDTAQLANSYSALSALYGATIEREKAKLRATLSPYDDRDTQYNHVNKMVKGLQETKLQIHYLEKAIELAGSIEHKTALKDRLENTLAQYHIATAQKFFTTVDVLLSPAKADHEDRSDLGGKSGTSGTLNEILKYVNPLKKRIQSICEVLAVLVYEEAFKPAIDFQFKDFIPHFMPWNEEIREHAFGLANVLFDAMECQPKPEGEIKPTSIEDHYAKIFDSALFLVDVSDKMKALGYAAPKKGQPRAQSNVGGIDDASIQAKLAKLKVDISIDAPEGSSPKPATPPQDSDISSGITDQKTRKLLNLLGQEPSRFFKSLYKSPQKYTPDTILQAANRAKESTVTLITSLERELTDPKVVQSTHANRIREKLEESNKELAMLDDPALGFDLYKNYSCPKAKHWLTLFNHQQIAKVHAAKKLSSESEPLYEIELVPTPNSDGTQAPPVFLHLHLTHRPVPKKKQSLISGIAQNPQLIKAAHLKSSYYRGKGKAWEKNNIAQRQYDELVKRSPVNTEFLEAVANFYSGRR